MAGYVKPPDKVRHKTGAAGAKVVVVWVPGEEGKRIASRWKQEPYPRNAPPKMQPRSHEVTKTRRTHEE